MALSLALEMTPGILSGRVPASRILTVPSNSWFAWGPALVLLLAHDHTPGGRWDILLLALAAQFVCDLAASAVRERMGGGISLRELADELRQIYLIDLALAPLGLLTAYAVVGRQWRTTLTCAMALTVASNARPAASNPGASSRTSSAVPLRNDFSNISIAEQPARRAA